MRKVLFFTVFVLVSTLSVQAQSTKVSKITPLERVKVFSVDTLFSIARNPLRDTLFHSSKIKPVDIPNSLKGKTILSERNAMPVAKLSGKNLAPMPGTENLDKEKQIENLLKPIVVKTWR